MTDAKPCPTGPATVEPTEVQRGGIGAPQAHWLGLIDQGVTVSSVPQFGGPDQPRIAVRIVNEGRILTHDEARELSAELLSAIAWTGR